MFYFFNHFNFVLEKKIFALLTIQKLCFLYRILKKKKMLHQTFFLTSEFVECYFPNQWKKNLIIFLLFKFSGLNFIKESTPPHPYHCYNLWKRSNFFFFNLFKFFFSALEKFGNLLNPIDRSTNSFNLSLDPVVDKTPLYSQLLQTHKWTSKVSIFVSHLISLMLISFYLQFLVKLT